MIVFNLSSSKRLSLKYSIFNFVQLVTLMERNKNLLIDITPKVTKQNSTNKQSQRHKMTKKK